MKKIWIITLTLISFGAVQGQDHITRFHQRLAEARSIMTQIPEDASIPSVPLPDRNQVGFSPLKPIRVNRQMNPQQDLIVGYSDPNEEVTITGEYFLNGNIMILNQGILNIADAEFRLRGNIFIMDSAKFNIRGSQFLVLSEYIYQHSIMGLDNSATTLDSSDISINGKIWNAAFLGNSHLTINDTHFNDGITASVWGNAEVDILRSNPFEWVIFDSAIVNVSQGGPHIFWFGFPDSSHASLTFPDGEFVTDFSISAANDSISGIGYSFGINNSIDIWWGLILQTGSDVTVRDSDLRTTGIMADLGDSLEISGLVNNQYYSNFTAPISDRNFRLINTNLRTWNVYSWGIHNLSLNNSIIGELGMMGETKTNIENVIVDGSGGYVFTEDESYTFYFVSSIFSHVIANDRSFQIFVFSSLLNGDVIATDASIMLFANSLTARIPVARDTSLVVELAVNPPENPAIDQLLPIIGTAFVTGGPFFPVDLDSYQLNYRNIDNPAGWFPIGSVHTEEIRNDILETWDTHGLETGLYDLRLILFLSEEDSIETYQWVYLGDYPENPNYIDIEADHIIGWNLVGLPLEVENVYYADLFPDAVIGTLYSFDTDSGYQPDSDLVTGTGYWLRFPEGGSNTITGTSFADLSISLRNGWNLISGISSPVATTDISDPSAIIIPGTVWDWAGVYMNTDTLIPGKGYWIRANVDGEIVISTGVNKMLGNTPLEKLSSENDFSPKATWMDRMKEANYLEFQNAEGYRGKLYFGITIPEDERLSYGLPPMPPAGGFDIRFSGDWIYSEGAGEIQIANTAYPMTVFYNVTPQSDNPAWRLENPATRESYDLSGSGEIIIYSPVEMLKLNMNKKILFPEKFTLYQNYPNPFNAQTKIEYQLPIQATVILNLFDLGGREICTLVNQNQKAGNYSIEWDGKDNFGKDVSSGVYLYQLQASPLNNTPFSKIRKMVVIK